MYNRGLFEICDGNHIMLVYDGNEAKLDAAAHFINEGLVNNQLCIYASVHAFDNENNLSISNLKTRIKDYNTNLKEDNLLFIDFKPYYESAAEAKLEPFKFLKQKIETMLRNRVSLLMAVLRWLTRWCIERATIAAPPSDLDHVSGIYAHAPSGVRNSDQETAASTRARRPFVRRVQAIDIRIVKATFFRIGRALNQVMDRSTDFCLIEINLDVLGVTDLIILAVVKAHGN